MQQIYLKENKMSKKENLNQFIEDVCITIAGKRNQLLSPFENIVFKESWHRLEKQGVDLIIARGAQLKFEQMKANVESYKKQCIEDKIELKD
jgi:Fe-S oxidoreductase